MSRIGRTPIEVPSGVEVDARATRNVAVSGPQGRLERDLPGEITVRGARTRCSSSSAPTTSGATGPCTA